MSAELHDALTQIAAAAGRGVPTVDLARVRLRLRRRRVGRAAAGSSAALAAVAAVVVAATTLGGARVPAPVAPVGTPSTSATPTASATPTPAPQPTTALPGWVPGAAPCGQTPAFVEADDAGLEIQGGLVPGTLDPVTAGFRADPTGTVLLDEVEVTSQVPGRGATGSGSSLVQLVDASGAVAFWNDPDRVLPQIEATDGSGMTSLSWLYDAVDCRTGRALSGTYRAFAIDGGETVELAPVTFGDGPLPAGGVVFNAPGSLEDPTCGQPLSDAVRGVIASADLVVTTDGLPFETPGVAGLHAAVTVAPRDPGGGGGLVGRLPQGLATVLVDQDGLVVTTRLDPMEHGADSARTVDLTDPASTDAEIFDWFIPCASDHAALTPGTYGLYVYDTVDATDGQGGKATWVVAGGPFPITLGDERWG